LCVMLLEKNANSGGQVDGGGAAEGCCRRDSDNGVWFSPSKLTLGLEMQAQPVICILYSDTCILISSRF